MAIWQFPTKTPWFHTSLVCTSIMDGYLHNREYQISVFLLEITISKKKNKGHSNGGLFVDIINIDGICLMQMSTISVSFPENHQIKITNKIGKKNNEKKK